MKLSNQINLEFNKQSFKALLKLGSEESQTEYSHKQIAEWCEMFWNKYHDIDTLEEIENLMPILASVETQWDLYLVNTYSVNQLESMDLELITLPFSWFADWLGEIDT